MARGKGYTWIKDFYPDAWREVQIMKNSTIPLRELLKILQDILDNVPVRMIATKYGAERSSIYNYKSRNRDYLVRIYNESPEAKAIWDKIDKKET